MDNISKYIRENQLIYIDREEDISDSMVLDFAKFLFKTDFGQLADLLDGHDVTEFLIDVLFWNLRDVNGFIFDLYDALLEDVRGFLMDNIYFEQEDLSLFDAKVRDVQNNKQPVSTIIDKKGKL